MNPQKEIEILRNAFITQMMAVEVMNEWLRGEGGEDWVNSWCEALGLAIVRSQRMTTAEKFEYSQTRKGMFDQWIAARQAEYTNAQQEAS